ncbi:hypothetical protein VYU27_002328 [Nannochloropsis oceanica]
MTCNATATFIDVIRAQQNNDLQRIEAEQMMRGEKAYMNGKEREMEVLQTAIKTATAKRDSARATYDRLRADNIVQAHKNKAKRAGMLQVANIVDVTNKENDRSLEQHNKEVEELHRQLLFHIESARKRARFLCLTLKVDPDDPRVVEKGNVRVEEVEGEEGGGGGGRTLPLPSVGEEEVYKVEERMRDLWIELEGTTGTLEVLRRRIRQAQEERARAEEETASLAQTVEEERKVLAELQEEVEGKKRVWKEMRISEGGGGGKGRERGLLNEKK